MYIPGILYSNAGQHFATMHKRRNKIYRVDHLVNMNQDKADMEANLFCSLMGQMVMLPVVPQT